MEEDTRVRFREFLSNSLTLLGREKFLAEIRAFLTLLDHEKYGAGIKEFNKKFEDFSPKMWPAETCLTYTPRA